MAGHNLALTSVTGKGSQSQETNVTLCSAPNKIQVLSYIILLNTGGPTYHGHQYIEVTNVFCVHSDGVVLHQ